VDLVNRTTKRFGGTASFLAGALRAILRYRSEPVTLRVDDELVYDGALVLAAAANGRYFGGGMRVAPDAVLDDGVLDVVVVPHLSMRALLTKLPKIYAGTHLDDPAVTLRRGRSVEAVAEPGCLRLELDGEPLGALPARIDVLPGALTLLGPAA
jgi:diacylglycerol kinase family enzyme